MVPPAKTTMPRLLIVLAAAQTHLTAATIGERFEALKQQYEKTLLGEGAAADTAEADLLEKYSAALVRLKAEDKQIAGNPLREAAVDAEIEAVRSRLAGEEVAAERADPPPFTFPRTLDEWVQAPGEEIEVDLSERETRVGKPIGIEVRKGDRVRVIPNPIDKITRGSLSGDWRGIDRGWVGIRVHEHTATTPLSSIGKRDFIYTAKSDGELAVHVYTWDTVSGGTFRIKFLNLDAPDGSPEAKLPASFTNLKEKGDRAPRSIPRKGRENPGQKFGDPRLVAAAARPRCEGETGPAPGGDRERTRQDRGRRWTAAHLRVYALPATRELRGVGGAPRGGDGRRGCRP